MAPYGKKNRGFPAMMSYETGRFTLGGNLYCAAAETGLGSGTFNFRQAPA